MKLFNIIGKKVLLTYLIGLIIKAVGFETVQNIVTVQREINYIKSAIEEGNGTKITFGLLRLSKLDDGVEAINELYLSIQDDSIKKRFNKYLA